METALNIAQFFAALMWTSFTVWYMIRAKWWKSAFGWNTMLVSATITVLLVRLTVLTYNPNFKMDLLFFGTVLYTLFGVTGAHRLFLLERAQRSGNRRTD